MVKLFATLGSLDEGERRYLREGLQRGPTGRVRDLLQKDTLTKGEGDSIKKVAKELLDRLSSGKL